MRLVKGAGGAVPSGYVIGEALSELKRLPAECANTCVTSPPYWGLRDYGGQKDQIGREKCVAHYVERLVVIMREVRRVMRNDGTLWLNIGDTYMGPGGGKQSPSGALAGRRIAASSGPRAKHVKRSDDLCQKQLVGAPWRVAFALQDDGWLLRADIVWHKPNAMPESVKDRPTRSHEYLFLFSKSKSYYYDYAAIREAHKGSPSGNGFEGRQGGARDTAVDGGNGTKKKWEPSGFRNKRTVWTVPTQPYVGEHYATFPPKLIEPCILAGAPLGGLVIDPFLGSGTTAMVAEGLGRRWWGCDLDPKNESQIRDRTAQCGLFSR